MNRLSLKVLFLFFACIGLYSCGSGNHDTPEPPIPPTSRSLQTLLVYMGGDNNLAAETYQKLTQIAKGWDASSNTNIVVYQDTPFGDSPRLIRITGYNAEMDVHTFEQINKYDKENSADPNVLNRAIREAFNAYPADNYGLIVFSHGSGWLPPNTISDPIYKPSSKSIIIDNDDEMDIKDFAQAIPEEYKFEYILFEACNMANIEVAYELKDKAEYIVGSSTPIVSPGFTDIYANSISLLLRSTPDLVSFARNYFNYWNALSGLRRSATISVIKTSELSSLADIVRSIKENNNTDIDISSLQRFDGSTASPYYFFDFNEYYSLLADDGQKNDMKNIIDKCIIYKENTPTYSSQPDNVFPIREHSGLSTYIEQKELQSLNVEYYKLSWYHSISGN